MFDSNIYRQGLFGGFDSVDFITYLKWEEILNGMKQEMQLNVKGSQMTRGVKQNNLASLPGVVNQLSSLPRDEQQIPRTCMLIKNPLEVENHKEVDRLYRLLPWIHCKF